MTNTLQLNSPHHTAKDRRLVDLLDKCLVDLQCGRPVNREALLADNPDIADELAEYLDSLQFISAFRAADEPLTPDLAQSLKTLGEYRLIREIGRGGMGIVYEAQQLSLDRRVALKVLPFAAVLDPRHLQRFKNEALAAAHLDHPNIVEVYGVGCERGVHFYAMRYVEGHTLAAVIEAMKDEVRRAGDVSPPMTVTTSSLSSVENKSAAAEAAPAASVGNGHSFSAVADAVPAPPCATGSASDSRTPTADKRIAESRPPTAAPHSAFPIPHSPFTETSPLAALSTLRTANPRHFFRTIAHLGIQAAEALDHAHQMGIVHRDIKPSNLMVETQMRNVECGMGNDEPGDSARKPIPHSPFAIPHSCKLFITDFGLAHIETSASLTMTGDLVGTLRYMSPEQAEGRFLDHRTDIYSLGVTLYELLTLRPAFPAEERQALLKQLINDEPLAPRKLHTAIPADLETIILKSISKQPPDRYQTARHFADDLRRFAAWQPIKARPPSFAARAWRWISRHRAVVTTALVTLLLAFSASTVVIVRAWQSEQSQRQTAENNLAMARQAVDDMYTKVATGWLANETALSSVQVEFLQKALGFYGRLANLPADTPAKRYDAGVAAERASDIHQFWHDYDAAADTLRQAIDIQEALLKDDPANEQYIQSLVTRYRKLGVVEELRSKLADSGAAYQQGWRYLEMLLSQDPSSSDLEQERVRYQLHRATLLDRQRDFDGAERIVREAQAAIRPLMTLVGGRASLSPGALELKLEQLKCDRLLARVLRHQGRLDEAQKTGSRALSVCSRTRSGHFHDARPLHQFAASLHDELAEIALAADRAPDAVTHFRQSLAEQQRLLGANLPPVAFFGQYHQGNQHHKNLEEGLFLQYSETQLRLAAALDAAGRRFEAEETLCEALWTSLLNQRDFVPQVSLRHLLVSANSSSHLDRVLRERQPRQADEALQMAAIVWQWIEDEFPDEEHNAAEELDRLRRHRPDILEESKKGATSDDPDGEALWRRCLAIASLRAGRWEEAIKHLTFAAERRTVGKAYDWFQIAMAHHHLNHADDARQWYDRAVASLEAEKLQDEDLRDLRLRTAQLIGRAEKITTDNTNNTDHTDSNRTLIDTNLR